MTNICQLKLYIFELIDFKTSLCFYIAMGDQKKKKAFGPELLSSIIEQNSIYSNPMFCIHKKWEGIVGEGLSKICRPVKISEQTLIISTKNNAWMHELNFNKDTIIHNTNKTIGAQTIKDIKFILTKDFSVFKHKVVKQQTPRIPTKTEEEFISNSLKDIKSEDLRLILYRAYIKQKQYM